METVWQVSWASKDNLSLRGYGDSSSGTKRSASLGCCQFQPRRGDFGRPEAQKGQIAPVVSPRETKISISGLPTIQTEPARSAPLALFFPSPNMQGVESPAHYAHSMPWS